MILTVIGISLSVIALSCVVSLMVTGWALVKIYKPMYKDFMNWK
jgi:hypothetical protein